MASRLNLLMKEQTLRADKLRADSSVHQGIEWQSLKYLGWLLSSRIMEIRMHAICKMASDG